MHYHTIVADPPWQYNNTLAMGDGVKRSAMSQYSTLALDQVKTFLIDTSSAAIRFGEHGARWSATPLWKLIKADAHLWLWVTNPFLLDGSGAAVCRAWGFEPKALVTWTKGRVGLALDRVNGHAIGATARITENMGMGRYTRGVTEHLIFATRGKAQKLVKDKGVTNWFLAPSGQHSEKPDEAYTKIERVSPGPYLDIFARKFRPGWDAIGDELPVTGIDPSNPWWRAESGPDKIAAVRAKIDGAIHDIAHDLSAGE